MINNPTLQKARTKKMIRTMFIFSLVSLVVFVALFSCSSGSKYTSSIDLDTVEMIQLEPPAEGDQIAVIHTSLGDISAVLYPSEAPNAVANFISLAESGFYDNTYVFRVEQDVFFAAGSTNADGTLADGYNKENETVAQEFSQNLWPIRGALCALENASEAGFFEQLFGNPESYNGCRFLITDTITFTDELLAELMEDNEENPVAVAFRDYGGVPNYSQQMTIFGQTYDGFETIDAITSAALTGEDGAQVPAEEIRILSIEIATYSAENSESEK